MNMGFLKLAGVVALSAALLMCPGCRQSGVAREDIMDNQAAEKMEEPAEEGEARREQTLESAAASPSPAIRQAAEQSSATVSPSAASVMPTPENSTTVPDQEGKIAYLTFDDGPSPLTELILGTLKKYGVKATFFVTGSGVEKHGDIYIRIAREGHKLGNHTYSHDYRKLYRSAEDFMEDVRKLDRYLLEATGQRTDLIRFPGGSNIRSGRRKGQAWIMPQLAKRVQEEGYQYFDWNVSSTDAAQAVQPKKTIVRSVLTSAREKDKIIVLMHDAAGKTTTADALPEVIRGLQKQGFRFDVLHKDVFTVQFLKAKVE
jgi:peptidoglycan-N-acetylglucosamine deacetylase